MVNHPTVGPLLRAVGDAAPDVVVISGDLTQRARAAQFQEAREFLNSLPQPQLVVPGNHDVPYYNVLARFLSPLDNYRKYISADVEPSYEDAEVVIQGLNTARSWTFKNGRINQRQIELVRDRFCGAPAEKLKILVTHHPLDLPRKFDETHLVGRAALAMPTLAACGVDLLLAGHYHIAHTGDTRTRYALEGFSALVVHAGTTISTRRRDEPNSFNLLRVTRREVIVECHIWSPAVNAFALFLTERFQKGDQGWSRVPSEPVS